MKTPSSFPFNLTRNEMIDVLGHDSTLVRLHWARDWANNLIRSGRSPYANETTPRDSKRQQETKDKTTTETQYPKLSLKPRTTAHHKQALLPQQINYENSGE